MKSDLMLQEDAKARRALPEAVVQYIEECRAQKHSESYLIAVLHRVQRHCGYLAREHMDAVATLMQIPTAKVTGVASFYHFFAFAPRGEHRVSVCMGTACFVQGAERVLARLKELLGVEVGATTPDRKFSIEVARCVGACALAPVLIVDDKVYANVTPEALPGILADYGFDAGRK
jgi:NADH:ubiquinone oxidoreductase subunit E